MTDLEASYSYALEVWKSEEENARRLATKKALVAGFPGAILAFASLTGEEGRNVLCALKGVSIPAILSAIFFAASLFSLAKSIFRALGVRQAEVQVDPTASVALHPGDQEELERLVHEDQRAVRGEAALRLFSAAEHLRDANQALSEALQRALEWLFAGIIFLVAALVGYIFV